VFIFQNRIDKYIKTQSNIFPERNITELQKRTKILPQPLDKTRSVLWMSEEDQYPKDIAIEPPSIEKSFSTLLLVDETYK
jgi:hypothetical protein